MLKPSEIGSKCKTHEVFYETRDLPNGKTQQYCPVCEKERYKPFMDFLLQSDNMTREERK
jgi:hypothetical protein